MNTDMGSTFALADGSGHTVNPVVGVMGGLSSLFLIILGFVVWKRRKNFSFFDVFSNKETELSGTSRYAFINYPFYSYRERAVSE